MCKVRSLLSLLSAASALGAPQFVQLRNGVKMSLVSEGVWEYNSSEAYSSVTTALKVGFPQIDTALDYGNQEGVGKAIKDSGMPRDKVFVETKVPGCGMDKSTLNPFECYRDTKKNLDTDLQLLGLEFVDLVILHFPPAETFVLRSCSDYTGSCEQVRSQWKAMEEFYKANKTRAIGVSNYCPSCFECLNNADVFPMVNQVQYHLGMGTDPQGLFSYHKKKGIVTQAYSVLGAFKSGSHGANPEILHGNLTTKIAKAHNVSTVQVALKWIVAQDVALVTKSSNPDHLRSDLDLWSWDLAPEEMAELDAFVLGKDSPSFSCSSMLQAPKTEMFVEKTEEKKWCAEKKCGDPCLEGTSELLRFCQADGSCAAAANPECAKADEKKWCAEKKCGDPCLEGTSDLLRFCQANGSCAAAANPECAKATAEILV